MPNRPNRGVAGALLVGLLATGGAVASGGGGGGSVLQIGGVWFGQISFPAPVQLLQTKMTLTEDAAGNITGALDFGPAFSQGFVTGRARSDGTFQLRGEGSVLNGSVIGTVSCLDGTSGVWISGSVQERGGVSAFSFDNCPR